jgi:hypothetical protein
MSLIDRDSVNGHEVIYDVVEFTRAYLETITPAGQFRTRVFGSALGNMLFEAVSGMPFDAWPPKSGPTLVDVIVAHVNPEGPYMTHVSIGYERVAPLQLPIRMSTHNPTQLAGCHAVVGGSPEVWNQIRSGNDIRFDDLRRDPILRRFYSTETEQPTIDEAMAFAKALFAVTSERTPWLRGGTTSPVGADFDAVLLNHGRVTWLRSVPA